MGKQKHEFSPETQQLYENFKKADTTLREHWTAFMEANRAHIEYLDKLIGFRNALVTELKQKLREEVKDLDLGQFAKTQQLGEVSVQRQESWFYDPERFEEMLEEVNLIEQAEENGCIIIEKKVDKEKAKEFCERHDLESRLKRCIEKGKERAPSVSGLKKVAEFLEEVE